MIEASPHFALLSIVFMMGFVMLFDGIHRRNQRYQRIWSMYRQVMGGAATL